MFNKMLLCFDGSECSEEAAHVAAAFAKPFGSQVLSLQVCHIPIPVSTGPPFIPMQGEAWAITMSQDMMQKYIQGRGESHTKQMQAVTEETGCEFVLKQEIGHPVDTIVHVAQKEKVDLIVMGSHGYSGLKEFFLGSVSSGVVRYAPCSVLIVPEKKEPEKKEPEKKEKEKGQNFSHILLATDASPDSVKALQAGVEIAQKFATSLSVLNVLVPFGSPSVIEGEEVVWAPYYAETAADCFLKTIQEQVDEATKTGGVYCPITQERGSAAEGIVRHAEESHANLIVMGCRGLGGFAHLLLGSVSDYVVHHAPCPVLIVR